MYAVWVLGSATQPLGVLPTGMVWTTARDAVSITESALSPAVVT
ncbi:Uncharacterised protein [Mycobacterium tuberculosis]|nr:Uncharacterised protein [Mycobacterium tuberculosis]